MNVPEMPHEAFLAWLFPVFDTCFTGREKVCAWQGSTAELAQLRAARGSALPAPPAARMARSIQQARESLSWDHKAFLQGLKPTSSATSKHLRSYENVSVLHHVLAMKKSRADHSSDFGFHILTAGLSHFYLVARTTVSAKAAAHTMAGLWSIPLAHCQKRGCTFSLHPVKLRTHTWAAGATTIPFPFNTGSKYVRGDLWTVLPQIVLCSSCTTLDKILAFFQRLKVQ